MATITWERNQNTVGSPTWVDIGANTVVFSASATDLTAPILTTDWNDGTHIGSGDPGTDQCGGGPGGGALHNSNTKYVSSGNVDINGAGSEVLNDTNLVVGECTFRIHLNNASAVASQNSFFYSFDGTTTTVEAVGVECYGFEQGEGNTAWTQINDDSGAIGGDNSGERIDLGEETSATDLYWYIAVSARGESAGGKTSFDFGFKTEIF